MARVSLAVTVCALCIWQTAFGQVKRGVHEPQRETASLVDDVHPSKDDIAQCLALIGEGDFTEAHLLAAALLHKHPKSSRANLLAGLVYYKQNRYASAAEFFEAALALDPNESLVRPLLGWCLYYLGRPRESQEQFEEFLADTPDYGDAHYALGLLEFDADDCPSAINHLRRAIDLAKAKRSRNEEAEARTALADVYVRTGQLPSAKVELDKAAEAHPDDYAVQFRLARVLKRLGASAQATTVADQARRLSEKAKEQTGRPE